MTILGGGISFVSDFCRICDETTELHLAHPEEARLLESLVEQGGKHVIIDLSIEHGG